MVTPRDNYDVGYGKPPVQSRWKTGQSGNSKGRPKGARSLTKMVEDLLLYKKVPVKEGDRRQVIPVAEAILYKAVQQALQGDHRARDTVLRLLQSTERDDATIDDGAVNERDDEIVRESIRRLAIEIESKKLERQEGSLPADEHPDQEATQ